MKIEKEIGVAKATLQLMLCVAFGLSAWATTPIFGAGYETPPSAYDRFWYRSTYPYKKSSRVRVSMPVYAGLTMSNHSSVNVTANKIGFVGGLGFDFWTRLRRWSLGFDLLIVSKGFETSSASYSVTYFELPIMFRGYPTEWLTVQVGPYFSPFMVGARASTGSVSTDVKNEFKGDFGITFGIRLKKRIRYQAYWGLDLRYDFGLATIHDTLAIKPRTLLAMLVLDFKL